MKYAVEFRELRVSETEGKRKKLNFVNFWVNVLFLEVEFRELPVRWRNAKYAVEFRELHIGGAEGKHKKLNFVNCLLVLNKKQPPKGIGGCDFYKLYIPAQPAFCPDPKKEAHPGGCAS